ncbi:sulfatase [Fontisphaera persica]|uniref:sulfatase n=1 Tax=Fontisphaera persica TaxID=2974023 RepID=UPI0024C032AD|nr:sulfatase [Fontisphaera persica]WCJ58333.1 sulfatase [Fontisphaera persica]
MKRAILGCLGLMAGVLGLCFPAHPAAPAPPNFIFILVDDLGWTDAGCYGSRFYQTPHMDRLAREGMRFTQAYAACTVCSPTRAAILTGKYPARLHLTDWIAGHRRPYARLKPPDWKKYLPHEEITLAEALKPLGYATASIGKWHLGGTNYYPEKHGFDLNLGGTDRGQPPSYFAPYKIATLPEGPPGEFLTDREAAEACRFIEANRQRPFFLYLPHYAVHTPIQAKEEVRAKYQARVPPGSRQTNAAYAALVESVDDSLGRILHKLAELQLEQRTIVFFTSDNGGLKPVTDNAPLRDGKGSAYEGGVRVMAMVKWPGVTKPGSVNDTPIISMDFYPTILEIAGAPLRPGQVVDGESLVPLLRGSGSLKRTALFWHYPHYHPGGATPYSAIREGDFRLVEFFEDRRLELYDLKNDVGEQQNLAAARPELAARLRARLEAWRREVGAQLPLPNPDYAPEKDRFGAAPTPAGGGEGGGANPYQRANLRR